MSFTDQEKEEFAWTVIDRFFADNPDILVKHHLDSFDDLIENGIPRIFKQNNPIRIIQNREVASGAISAAAGGRSSSPEILETAVYMGGKEGNRIYYGKPIIYDNKYAHYMYPNEARIRNMTYGMSIHYDVDVEFTITHPDGTKTVLDPFTIEKMYFGRIPIMVRSKACVLSAMPPTARFEAGECREDPGGYFIVDGREKVIVSQEKFADNMLYISNKADEKHSLSAKIRTVSEDPSKPQRTLSMYIMAPTVSLKNGQIVIDIPNVRVPVPLFILMRALGIISDKEIIEYCLLDLKTNASLVDDFIPSVHDAGRIYTQDAALEFIALATKEKKLETAHNILSNFFLPNVGTMNYLKKAYMIGYMVYRMLRVKHGIDPPTDRDNFKYKRIMLSGSLIYELFLEYYVMQMRSIQLSIDKKYYYDRAKYEQGYNFRDVVIESPNIHFQNRIVEDGIRKGFKGGWGAKEYTTKEGIAQELNRLSFNSAISHLRKLNLPMDPSAKVTAPRFLHPTQWGLICPTETPDGANIGLHKHLAISTHITTGFSSSVLTPWLRSHGLFPQEECSLSGLSKKTKVFVNGVWVGVLENPMKVLHRFKLERRAGLIPIFASIHWQISRNELIFFTDAGRTCRPIFYTDGDIPSFNRKHIRDNHKLIEDIKKQSWPKMLVGEGLRLYTTSPSVASGAGNSEPSDGKNNLDSITKRILTNSTIFPAAALLRQERSEPSPSADVAAAGAAIRELSRDDDEEDATLLQELSGMIEFLDPQESEGTLIAMDYLDNHAYAEKHYTHIEIHPSLIHGVLANFVNFAENNPQTRDLFSCGQSKQAVSIYHSNFQNRVDKMAVVLNNGEIPIIKSRYMKYVDNEQHPYGHNTIVAIMCYSGFNVEDSIIFNEGALKRGLFRTTYYSSYQDREESTNVGGGRVDTRFLNIMNNNVSNIRAGFDYNYLDENGLIRENTPLNDKIILIGKGIKSNAEGNAFIDDSMKPKKGQLGFVDKAFMTEGDEGHRIAKVRIREDRIPTIGDKFCSRAGQKGTIGVILSEADMPFTAEGIRPDIIINPHAIPTRMTIGQLVECIIGKACLEVGAFGDCTPFVNRGTKLEQFGNILPKYGYNSSGNEVLYNGMTGEMLEANIFVGPTYYLRLKHMVKDKINYRARGPRTQLTRQTVHGRANDGGLRIGEMERDGIVAHGMDAFLNESMMLRGDEYYMAVCNKTGCIAIYNPSQNIFLSPMADGPIKFKSNLEGSLNVESVSRYGRDFSVVRIPYTLKLLMQELGGMNIQMRLITEDNVDQLMALSYDKQQLKLNTGITDYDKLYMNYQTAKNNRGRVVGTTLQDIVLYFRDATQENYKNIRFTIDGRDFSSRVEGADFLMEIIRKFFHRTDVLRFTDGTANIGTDAINVADFFYSVNAIELVSDTAAALNNNVVVLKKSNIRVIVGDSNVQVPKLVQDIVLIDAPWGGREYKRQKEVKLYLGKTEIAEFYNANYHFAKMFIFKVPINYPVKSFIEKVRDNSVGFNVFNYRSKKDPERVIYYLIVVKTPLFNDPIPVYRNGNLVGCMDVAITSQIPDDILTLKDSSEYMSDYSEILRLVQEPIPPSKMCQPIDLASHLAIPEFDLSPLEKATTLGIVRDDLVIVKESNMGTFAEKLEAAKYTRPIEGARDLVSRVQIAKKTTMDYMFHIMKFGIFVSIRNNKVAVFQPFRNNGFKNNIFNAEYSYVNLEEFPDGVGIMDPVSNTISAHSNKSYYGIKMKYKSAKVSGFVDENIMPDPATWYVNGTMVGNVEAGDQTGYLNEIREMLNRMCDLQKDIPNVDFFINRRDWPNLFDNDFRPEIIFQMNQIRGIPNGYRDEMSVLKMNYLNEHGVMRDFIGKPFVPILSFSTLPSSLDLPIPTPDDWQLLKQKTKIPLIEWKDRMDKVYFRGSATGAGISPVDNVRLRVVDYIYTRMSEAREDEPSYDGLSMLDVGITSWAVRDKLSPVDFYMKFIRPPTGVPELDEFATVQFRLVAKVPMEEQQKAKFNIYIDGNGAAYRMLNLLARGFCIIRVIQNNPIQKFALWFDSFMKPWVHYIPVDADNLVELERILMWIRANDAECEKIASNARKLFEWLGSETMFSFYLRNVLCGVSSLYKDELAASVPAAASGAGDVQPDLEQEDYEDIGASAAAAAPAPVPAVPEEVPTEVSSPPQSSQPISTENIEDIPEMEF